MFSALSSLLLGITQGLTEFIPVSSSGHLFLLRKFLNQTQNSLALDAFLHLATSFSLIFYYRKKLYALITNRQKSRERKMLIIATLPAAIAGLTLENFIDTSLRSPWIIVFMLSFIGLLMWITETHHTDPKHNNIKSLALDKVIFIGFLQAVALIPGTSRSGITIVAGMLTGLSRKKAVEFSFLLGIPLTLGAGLIKLPEIMSAPSATHLPLLLSSTSAFITGLFAIKWMFKFLNKHSLKNFTFYRIALALILTFLLLT